jgi:hypothetical protein
MIDAYNNMPTEEFLDDLRRHLIQAGAGYRVLNRLDDVVRERDNLLGEIDDLKETLRYEKTTRVW